MENNSSLPGISLGAIKALNQDRVFLVGETDQDREMDFPYQRLIRRKSSLWKSFKCPISACIVGRIDPALEIYVVGLDGEILRGTSSGYTLEKIFGVDSIGHLRAAALVNDQLIVAGMGRQVYRRVDVNQYETLTPPKTRTGLCGFNTLLSDGQHGFYAAGFEGEIWHFDGVEWSQEISPTKNIINAGVLLPTGEALFCGQLGEVIVGQKGSWKVLPQPYLQKDLWDVCFFSNKAFMASSSHVIEMDLNYQLKESSLNKIEGLTSGQLSAADGLLWSCGSRHLYVSEDGDSWSLQKIDCSFADA